MKKSLRQRIKEKVWKRQGNKCWPFLGHIDEEGYARIWVDKEKGSLPAHSVLYQLDNGPLSKGSFVLTCPLLKDCMNPSHFGVGTSADVGDRILWKKGQTRRAPRDALFVPKLTDEQVRQIYFSQESTRTLVERYNVTKATICNIRSGRTHKHLTQFEKGDTDGHSIQDTRRSDVDGTRD